MAFREGMAMNRKISTIVTAAIIGVSVSICSAGNVKAAEVSDSTSVGVHTVSTALLLNGSDSEDGTDVSVTVTFNPNGGAVIGTASLSPDAGAPVGVLPQAKLKGYSFLGWFTEQTGGTQVTAVSSFDSDTTVYAQWAKISTGSTSISKVTEDIGSFSLSYKAVSKASGYQIRCSLKSSMASSTVFTTSGKSLCVSSLPATGNYYVQVRAYKVDSASKNVYGSWSTKKTAAFQYYRTSLTKAEKNAILGKISSSKRKAAIKYALSKLGYPYSQAYRNSGKYYDCSSLAFYSWKSAGVNISYKGLTTAAAEAQGLKKAKKNISYKDLKPGSLIFFSFGTNGRYKNISHVAIYCGDGKVVEAAGTSKGVIYRYVPYTSNIVLIGKP